MISRVVEAKPEELRVFLEEAAGVSKYKERRKETEGGSPTRARTCPRRGHPQRARQPARAARHQARVATEFRELEARHRLAQQVLWYSRQQDAMRTRERCGSEIAQLTVALESLQAEVAVRRGQSSSGCAPTTTRRVTRCTTGRGRSTPPIPR